MQDVIPRESRKKLLLPVNLERIGIANAILLQHRRACTFWAAYTTRTTPASSDASSRPARQAARQLVLHERPYEHARCFMTRHRSADVPREPDQRGHLGGAPLPHDSFKGPITTEKASRRPLQGPAAFSLLPIWAVIERCYSLAMVHRPHTQRPPGHHL